MEVLDPASPESYLREDQLGPITAGMLDSPLLTRVSPSILQSRLNEGLEYEAFEAHEMEMARKIFILQSISLFALVELFDDERAMSEHHIAGEICRINRVLQAVVGPTPMGDLVIPEGLEVEENMTKSDGSGLWVPPGTTLVCPTIDGNPWAQQWMMYDPNFGMRGKHSYHLLWRSNLTRWLNDQVEAGGIKKLEPPFVLTSGREVDHTETPFYAPIKGPGVLSDHNDPSITPPTLVDA